MKPGKSQARRPSHRKVIIAIGSALPAQLAALTIVFSGAGHADTRTVSKQTVAAKMEYCQECHGASGQGYHGYYPIPRLAGQQPEYFANQLHAFAERGRANNIMYSVARSLNPSMITALAVNFRGLNPPPLEGGARRQIAVGREIFQNGDPAANVAACAACHAPDAKGTG